MVLRGMSRRLTLNLVNQILHTNLYILRRLHQELKLVCHHPTIGQQARRTFEPTTLAASSSYQLGSGEWLSALVLLDVLTFLPFGGAIAHSCSLADIALVEESYHRQRQSVAA